MRKMLKFLRLEDIRLEVEKQHPKDISRAFFKVIDASTEKSYKTFHYGEVQPTSITWDSMVQLPFQSQASLQFETICEHEYAYEREELKAMYNGVIYLKPDQFFFQNKTHCFNTEGEQCGSVRFMVKVVEREPEGKKTREVVQQPKQPVKINLIGKISIYGATFVVSSYHINTFHKKKRRNLQLEIRFGEQTFKGNQKFGELEYRWGISCKFDANDNSPESIMIEVKEDGASFLKGELYLSILEENKRFTVQSVPLTNQNGSHVATLQLDLRYVSKEEILDLMYSPKQLSDPSKPPIKESAKHFVPKPRSSSVADNIRSNKKLAELLHGPRASHRDISPKKSRIVPASHRYKAALFAERHELSIPRSKRFSESRAVNEHVSYIEPSFLSSFSPEKARKGASQSSTNKVDFTRERRDNPGVGQYHLPSIWQKNQ